MRGTRAPYPNHSGKGDCHGLETGQWVGFLEVSELREWEVGEDRNTVEVDISSEVIK